MPEAPTPPHRVRTDGKFFRLHDQRFFVQGVTYGTFAPNTNGEPFPEPHRALADLDLIAALGANTVRTYDLPPPWLLEAAAARHLQILVTLPWTASAGFLASRSERRSLRHAVARAVRSLIPHPNAFALALANEIPPDILRWNQPRRVARFLDDLTALAHDLHPDLLITYANYPSTEFLQPRELDFVTFNVFLHQPETLARYLARLHVLAGDRPLLLGECGVDSLREGNQAQASILDHTLLTARTSGLAGAVVFSFTDDWHRGGQPVLDWALGLTDPQRQPKPAFATVQSRFTSPPPDLPANAPKVTVVVAAYNAAPTLAECLDSLLQLHYPHLEILVIDDGSTDRTPDITARYDDHIRTLRLPRNQGLSHARNLGIQAATGAIVAFTDADCEVDPDWLRFLIPPLLHTDAVGVGGPNLLPPNDGPMPALVMVAPGGPTHVLLDPQRAEHIPGCNMAFWKWALDAVDRFDPLFHQAGDDVDLGWRLQRRGWSLAFAAAAVVWHHRRTSLRDYLHQQAGYGTAEALLMARHPERFNALGGARWQGEICHPGTPVLPWAQPAIYHGIFAMAPFQTLYTAPTSLFLPLLTSLEFHLFIALPLLLLALFFPVLWPFVAAAFALPPALALFVASRTPLPKNRRRFWSRPALALLLYLQPLVRAAARHSQRLSGASRTVPTPTAALETEARIHQGPPAREPAYWSPSGLSRRDWITSLLAALEQDGWTCRADTGWNSYDLEVSGPRWARLEILTVSEPAPQGAMTLRARLQPRWTLAAHLAFWTTFIALLTLLGLLDLGLHALPVPLALLAALAWFLHRQSRRLQCRIHVLLDTLARQHHLTPIT